MKVKHFLIALLACSVYSQEAPKEVWNLANETIQGKHAFIEFGQSAGALGFDPGTSLSDLTLGAPFKTYWVDSHAAANSSDATPVSSILLPGYSWAFPVLVKGKMKVRIEFDNDHGTWTRGRSGAASIMAEWENVVKAWPASSGYHPVLVEGDFKLFFHVPERDAYNLTPIEIASSGALCLRKASGRDYRHLHTGVGSVGAVYKKVLSQQTTEDK